MQQSRTVQQKLLEKNDFPTSVPDKMVENFFVTLRSFFSTYKFFPAQGLFLPVSTTEEEYCKENMSSIPGLKKSSFNFPAKVPILAFFGFLGQSPKTIYRQNFKKLVCWDKLLKSLCLILSFLSLWACGVVAVLQVDIFQNP